MDMFVVRIVRFELRKRLLLRIVKNQFSISIKLITKN